MLWFILAIICVIAFGVMHFIRVPKYETSRDRYGERVHTKTGERGLGVFLAIPLVLAAALFVMSMSTHVEAKNVGVVTSWGKPIGSIDPGFHVKAPWHKVTDIDGTIQKNAYNGNDALPVRIGDGSRSYVAVTLRWHVNPKEADTVYADYRSDDPTAQVGTDLVSPQFQQAMQKTLAEYNPCASLSVVKADDAGAAAPESFAPDYDAMSRSLEADMTGRSDLVEVDEVNVTYVSISDNTQKCLDDFTKAVGQTVAAGQNKETSRLQADANNLLSSSVKDPGLNTARCLDAVNKAIDKGYQFNAGFSCFDSAPDKVLAVQ